MKNLALMIVLSAFAATSHAAPETYVIDNSQTASLFSFSTLGGASQTHKFDKVSGKVVFDQAANTGSAEVTIDAASVNTGHRFLNQQLQSASFFDAANHPAIKFKSSKMDLQGEAPSMSGELTIKGVSKPVTLAISEFKCDRDPTFNVESCGAQVSVTVKRSDFNMGKYTFLASNEITLNIAIKAVKPQTYIQLASRDSSK